MKPVEAGSCIAVYVPMTFGDAIAGIVWYNNDESIVFPEVLVASGVATGPESVTCAYPVAQAVNGQSSDWSELPFTEPIAVTGDGVYVVFRLPEGSEHTADGLGGGAGIGYTVGANGFTGWLSDDGEAWVMLDEAYGIALDPIIIPAEEGMVEKDLDAESEVPVSHTALLDPAPNPFNPQTTLRFQLKAASDVDLSIYSVKGERVARLAIGSFPAGHHSVTWNGTDAVGRRVSSGAYLVRFAADGVNQTRRILLVK